MKAPVRARRRSTQMRIVCIGGGPAGLYAALLLKRADPEVVMMHWKGLTDWDFFEQRLLGATDGPDPQKVKRAATLAADAFLKLYGPDEGAPRNGKKRKARARSAAG